ncbi:MAG: thiol-disulfide oxidoreductase DCC family protein [Saprospiraceae bacterium]
MTKTGNSTVLLFDGVCNLCNASVQWVLLRDKSARFQFASLQSETGQDYLQRFGLDGNLIDSVVLIADGKVHIESDAALGVAVRLGFPWVLAGVFYLVPRFIRNAVYKWIARNRYRWFGKSEQCMMPQPEWKARFLD